MTARVTFGMIVLNGAPFTAYNLRALYPFAHQIIVVEGACPAAAAQATPDGHSTDGTREVLRQFQHEQDPEEKLIIVTAEDEGYPDGFWPGEKDEMSRAYARRATGNLLWQVDADEFYQPEDMVTVLRRLEQDPELAAVTFNQITFWGDLATRTDGFFLRRHANPYRRLFRWGRGYTYAAHRPPTVLDAQGRDLNHGKVLSGTSLAREGIFLYHYSLLFPRQVMDKTSYYAAAHLSHDPSLAAWGEQIAHELVNPFRVHNCTQWISWLERFSGNHPPEVQRMWADVLTGQTGVLARPMDDAHRLMGRPWFRLCRFLLRAAAAADATQYGARRWRAQRRLLGRGKPSAHLPA